jgi:hypothetical protein
MPTLRRECRNLGCLGSITERQTARRYIRFSLSVANIRSAVNYTKVDSGQMCLPSLN